MRNKRHLLFVALIFTLSLFVLPQTSEASNSWAQYTRGVAQMEAGNYYAAIKSFERSARSKPLASTYRRLAQSYEKVGNNAKASETYYKEAEIFKRNGDMNTYRAVKAMGDALNTEIDIFTSAHVKSPAKSLAKYEPENGAYFGAYLPNGEPKLSRHHRHQDFNEKTGKQHSIFFNYHRYGQDFPKKLAADIKAEGGALQLALEPNNGLGQVKDNAYLRQFARDANEAGIPIFLRFASEMNGSWVAWHGNPKQYRQKFALVAKVMREEAPNVAMTWVPNSVPADNIDPYYPGDKAVDWVGLNLYSVPVFNGDPNSPAEHVNPLDLLDDFYHKYAKNKPMMIGEYAASHFTSAGNRDVTQFGVTKMKMFYHGLQMKYPQVKAVHWFNVDTIGGANIPNERRLNNFNLLHNNQMLNAYKEVIRDPYFRSEVVNGPKVSDNGRQSPVSLELHRSTQFGPVKGMSFAKTYDPYISKVVYKLNNRYLSESNQYPFSYNIKYNQMKKGKNKFEAVVFDSKGRVAGRKTVTFNKGPRISKTRKNELQLFVGETMVFNEEGALQLLAPVYTKNSRSFVPLRFISETIGANVNWNGNTRQITIKEGNQHIVLKEGSRTVTVNGKRQKIDVAPTVKHGTTFVPLRFITEVLGANVHYEKATRGINIKF